MDMLSKIKWCPGRDLNSHAPLKVRGILNPLCLPFHHPGTEFNLDVMLDYLSQVCQFLFKKKHRVMRDLCIIFLLANFSSCGFIKSITGGDDEPEVDTKVVFVKLNTFKITPSWFETIPASYRLDNNDGTTTPHEFFDVSPTLDKKSNEINFIVLNPRNSPNNYQIDLASGKRYLAHPFCDQDDVWNKYSHTISGPNFTMGVIPRYLTTDGTPLEIMVFGRETYYKDNDKDQFHRTKIIGGVVVQKCLKMGCLKNSEWRSNLVLVAVDADDLKFANVENMRGLKKVVDWDYTKAFIENYQGRIHTLKEEKPFARYLGDISAAEAISFVEKYGKFFDQESLVSLQKSCLVIYDYVEKKLFNVVKQKTVNTTEFMQNFKTFYQKYRDPFYTCSKYVGTGNINQDQNKMLPHWIPPFKQYGLCV